MAKGQRKLLGESLIDAGMITAEQLNQAEAEQRRSGLRLRKILVQMNLIAEEDLVSFLNVKHNFPRIELSNYVIAPNIIELIPEELARKYELVPVIKIGARLTCAMVDPWNIFAFDELRLKTNFIIEPAVATEPEIRKALDEYYGAKGSLEEIIRSFDSKEMGAQGHYRNRGKQAKEFEDVGEEPLVVRLVNLIILKAVQEGASDIHIEPEEKKLHIRLRVDGILHEVISPPKHLQSAIISRIKVIAHLNITERRIPQDGRFNMKMEGKEIDVRVSIMPTIHGENVVLRLLDAATALLGLDQLGFAPHVLEKYDTLIRQPYGIIVATGPTGSGKTTTLYGSLHKINTVEKNIITIEDPVEYKLQGIRQVLVNPKVNLTFANGLRSILRQDPDVIMVGEIRDFETAEIAIHAALTGHLVFSTLHTNDAPSTIPRLIDMGVEPFLIASSIIGIIAQRLVRVLCKECTGKGCEHCLHTGYKGRIGVYELMIPNEEIRRLTMKRASADEIRKAALKAGMQTLRQDGFCKEKDGVTSHEEVLRVTQEE